MRILPFLLLLLAFEAGAATYYINPSCSSAGDGSTGDCGGATGARTTPPSAVASDVWKFAAGSTLATTAQITLQNSMVLESYGTGAKPIISCTCAAGDVTLYAFNKSSITFRDIEVRRNSTSDIRGVITLQGTGGGHLLDNVTLRGGYNNLRILADAPSITVQDSEFSDAYDDNIYADVSVAFAVTGSRFSAPSTGTETGDNIQLDSWDGVATITDNVFFAAGDTKQALIANNNLTSAATLNAGGNQITGGRYGINSAVAGTISRNWLTGQAERGINLNPSNASVAQVVESNILAGSMSTAAIYVENAAGVAVEAAIRNNSMAGGFARGIGLKSDVTTGTATLLNNVIAGNGTAGQVGTGLVAGAGFTEDYTRFSGLATNSTKTLGANSAEAAPQFLGGTSPTTAEGFKPDCIASPLKNAGTNVGRIQDFTGRYFDDQPDIGAFACQGGTPRTTPTARAVATQRTTPTARAAAEARP
jgi:hypothetical protein